MIRFIIKFIGAFFLISGLLLLIQPALIVNWIESNSNNTSFYIFAIIFRLILGIIFIIGAGGSKYPVVFKIFGYFMILAAIVLLIIGQNQFQDLVHSIISNVRPFAPVSGLFAVALGGFILYSFSGNRK